MHSRHVSPRFAAAIAFALIVGAHAKPALAQAPQAAAEPQHPGAVAPDQEHDGPDMQMARDGSGTAWLPDTTPMYAIHAQRGPWQFMAHENAFIQFLHESGDRGNDQFGSINWIMGMAQRNAGTGTPQLRGMFSAEPWTIRGCGYPDLLASGERCQGEQIHDQQHPHDLVMEIVRGVRRAAEGINPLAGVRRPRRASRRSDRSPIRTACPRCRTRWRRFPIIGSMRRTSRSAWSRLACTAIAGRPRRSVFNGREPDENRTNLDFAPLDSVSGRVWFLPTPNWALQVSAGRLTEAEPSENGGPGIDVTRATASATYHSAFREQQHLGNDRCVGTKRRTRPRLECIPSRVESDVRRSRYLVRQIRGRREERARSGGRRVGRLLYCRETAGRVHAISEGVERTAARRRRFALGRLRARAAGACVRQPRQRGIRRVRDVASGRHDDARSVNGAGRRQASCRPVARW